MSCAGRKQRSWRKLGGALSLLLAAAPAFGGVDIEITGVTEELEANIRAFLSLTRYAGRNDLTAETVARLGRRIPAEVKSALEPLGYYASTATYATSGQDSEWTVRIDVDPGRAVRISESEVSVVGPGRDDPALLGIVQRHDLRPGARLNHGAYERVKGELLRVAANNGYLDADLTRNELIVDPAERRASIFLTIDTGERYRFGAIDLQQPVLKDSVARRLLRMRPGDPYTLDAILESQYQFDDSQYFTAVEFDPGTPDEATRTVPLKVTAQKNRRNRYAISGGYGTDTDARGKATWDNRFLNERGHRSQLQITGSSVVQEAAAKYVIPVMDVALEKVELAAGYKKEELGDLISRRSEFAIGLTQAFSTWQRVLFLRLSNEISKPDVGPANAETVPEQTFLLIPGVSFATLPPSLLDREPRRYTLYAELTGSPESLGSDATFLQLRSGGERVFDLAPRWLARLRGQVGLTWSDDFSTLPASHRFFAGGDNSVRGFGLNELSPIEELRTNCTPVPPATDPPPTCEVRRVRVGGRYLLVASAEIERMLPPIFGVSNLSLATFVDAGNAFDNFSDDLEYSAGLGLRYRLVGVASIGADVAQALSESGRSPRFHLRVTTLF